MNVAIQVYFHTKLHQGVQQTARGLKRILEVLEKLAEMPYAGTRLRGRLDGLWRWSVGKYRMVYAIEEKDKMVVFLDVGLRKTIY